MNSVLSYSRLSQITNKVPPFRGTLNRFPLLDRRANRKYFLVEQEDNKTVYKIVYGQCYDSIKISKEEFDKYLQSKHAYVYRVADQHYRSVATPNIIGTVREDNTFEISPYKGCLYQGDLSFLNHVLPGWFNKKSRMGGIIYSIERRIYPVFDEVRFNLDNMKCVNDVIVQRANVDRKKAKSLMKSYQTFFKVTEVMMKSMTSEGFIQLASELYDTELFDTLVSLEMPNQPVTDALSNNVRKNHAFYWSKGNELRDTAPLDAMICYCLALADFRLFNHLESYRSGKPHREASLSAYDSYYALYKPRFLKELYKSHPIFKFTEFKGGEDYGSSEWGVVVLADGKEVEMF